MARNWSGLATGSPARPKLFVTALEGARHIGGKDVVEVLPPGSPTKGDALAALRCRLEPRATPYIDDDVTDEDAFSCRERTAKFPTRP